MLEKTVETYLVDRVRAAGGDAYKFTSPARVSVPDRIVVFPPARIYFVELKRPGGVVTKGQLREHKRLRALGCDVRVIDSREAVDAFVREASAAPAPYLHVYEYPSPFGGTHREFSPTTWNGQRPARTVPLYATPQPTDESPALARRSLEFNRALAAPYGVEPTPGGHCERAGGCVCGGDLPRVREGCAEWVKSEHVPANEAGALRYAQRLATSLWQQHWRDSAPQWKVLDDMLGVLTQIDNMVCGLQPAPARQPEPLVLTSAEFSIDTVREAVEQGLWAADVKLTDDAWRNIEAILVEQARVDVIKAARATAGAA